MRSKQLESSDIPLKYKRHISSPPSEEYLHIIPSIGRLSQHKIAKFYLIFAMFKLNAGRPAEVALSSRYAPQTFEVLSQKFEHLIPHPTNSFYKSVIKIPISHPIFSKNFLLYYILQQQQHRLHLHSLSIIATLHLTSYVRS